MSSTQIFRSTLAVLAGIAVGYMVLKSIHILIVLLVAILIASAIRPFVERMVAFGIPTGLATILIYLGMALAIVVFTAGILPPVIEQLADYIEHDWQLTLRIVQAKDEVENIMATLLGREIDLINNEDVHTATTNFAEQVRTTAPFYADDFGQVLGDAVLVFVMGVYWLSSREKTVLFMLQFVPNSKREAFRRILNEIERSMGSYVRGLVIISVIVGFANFLVLTLLGVPNATMLGVIMGIATAIPIVGGYIGGGTVTFLAMLSSPLHGVFAFMTAFAIQQFENYVLTPRIMSQSTGMNPLLVMLAVFVGFSLRGVMGAMVAIPVLGIVAILIRYFVIEPYVQNLSEYTVEDGVAIFQTSGKESEPTPVLNNG